MRKLWLLLVWQICTCWWVIGQDASLPARKLTAYALTSVPDLWQNGPSAWRLLASNDGHDWTELDVRTNQQATGPRVRRVFPVTNQNFYRIYRLQVDGGLPNTPNGIWLAEMELMGPVVGVKSEAELEANITSSEEHPLIGSAVSAFDGDKNTRWVNYTPFHDGGCWIQCEYVREASLELTNLSQVQAETLLAAIPTQLKEKADLILTNLTVSGRQSPRALIGYALTSANDIPTRDPSDWRLLGSNDGGNHWDTLDVRRGEVFSARLHRRTYKLATPAHYAVYRLLIAARSPGGSMQLAELEPIYGDSATPAKYSMVVSASGDNAPMEKTEMAFDRDTRSKWLCFTDTTNQEVWLQWQLLPEIPGLPLINLDELKRVTTGGAQTRTPKTEESESRTLVSYTLTSASDAPERDPADWRLLGSDDGGTTWTTLDTRQGESFKNRGETRTYAIRNPRSCNTYRIEFSSVAVATNANSIQLADLNPVYREDAKQNPFSMVVMAAGDNAPWEGVEKLFDRDPQTKWLDFAGNISRASWVQWSLIKAETNFVRVREFPPGPQPGLPKSFTVNLSGVVVYNDAGRLGLVDNDGFELFQVDGTPQSVRPGDTVRIKGKLKFENKVPVLAQPDVTTLSTVGDFHEIRPGQNLDTFTRPALTSVEGSVVTVWDGELYTTVNLALEAPMRTVTVRILNPKHVPLPAYAGHKIRVRGVAEPIYDEFGKPFPGLVWAAGPGDVNVTTLVEASKPIVPISNATVLTSLQDIIDACKTQPDTEFKVKVRGVITYVDPSLDGWYLQNGADAIYVNDQLSAGVNPYLRQEGLYVELQGTALGSSGVEITPSASVKVLGKGRMPDPLRPTSDTLVSGSYDGRWVQLDGIVSALEKQRMTLRVNGSWLMVWINEAEWKGQDRLIGSIVRVSGVCSPLLNGRQQRFGVRLLVPSADCIQVLAASPENPFNLPVQSIASLLHASPRTAGVRTLLRKITGVVTYREPQMMFVQNGTDGIRVYPRDEATALPGDVVDVVGIAEADGLSPKLVQALVRKTGRQNLPEPAPINMEGMSFDDKFGNSPDAMRGTVQGTLVGLDANESYQILELQQDSSKMPCRAYLPAEAGRLTGLAMGSRVRLQGAFKAESDPVPDFGQVITSFEIYLSSPADVFVLSRPSWWTTLHTLWLLAGLAISLLVAFLWIRSLRVQVQRRTRELKDVIAMHEKTEVQLNSEISERKRMEVEIAKSHQELLDISRQAGMAEVATSVLHNVGNVLNSVNISSGMVAESLRKSSGANVAKVVALLDENASNLGEFIANDPKGKMIPAYLAQLAKQLEKERSSTLGEVDGLRQNIEHIKEIVAMQQTYAKVAGVTETVNVTDLIDDALRMNSAALVRHDVKVVRDFAADTGRITVDKHKVLQILVNIIRNAKYACDQAVVAEKLITVRIQTEDQRVSISVIDNGVGIPAENLTKIFNHGFTTRKDGHGFGLHSGALTAKELGGSLTATSEGPGKGATFTLVLPLQPPKAA